MPSICPNVHRLHLYKLTMQIKVEYDQSFPQVAMLNYLGIKDVSTIIKISLKNQSINKDTENKNERSKLQK